MTKAKKTAQSSETLVTFLLDRTGSMAPIRDDTIGAFNTYLETLQEEPAGISFSLIQFDSMSIDTIHKNVPVADARPLDSKTYVPRASTPLIDAAYKTIKAVETAVSQRDTSPKVVICIQTDGQENASTEHTWDELNALIKEKTALGWQFNFMGCGIDAYSQGARMGISAVNTMSYDRHDAAATRASFSASAQNTTAFAAGRAENMAYSGAQRMASKDAFASADLKALHSKVAPKPQPKKAIVDDIVL